MNTKDENLVEKFIELRAQGCSFARIERELGVTKKTLIAWSLHHQFEIQNLRAIETEAQAEQLLASRQGCWEALGRDLRRAETELAKRDLAQVSTERLLALVLALRRQARQEANRPIRFTSTVNDEVDPGLETLYDQKTGLHHWEA